MAANRPEDTVLKSSSKRRWGFAPCQSSLGRPTETLAYGDVMWKNWHWFVYRHEWSQVQFKFSHRTLLVKMDEGVHQNMSGALCSATVLENGDVLGIASFERLKRPHVFAEMLLGHRSRTLFRLASHSALLDSTLPDVEMIFAGHKVEDCWIEGNHMPIKRTCDSVVEVYDCASFHVRIQSNHCELHVKKPEHLIHASFLAALIWRHSSSENPG